MLKYLKIKNYKAFAEETTIELRPVTVLYGKNSSGKSSLCKLIDILSKAFSPSAPAILPLRNGEVVLGSRNEDLFYNNVLSGLSLDVAFEDGVEVDVEFLMNEGRMYVRKYHAHTEYADASVEYRSIDESGKDRYNGLVNLTSFEIMKYDPAALSFSVNHIGPIRSAAQRAVYASDIDGRHGVGYRGERTPYLLLDSYLRDRKLLESVSDWYKKNMEDQWFDFTENGPGSGSFSLMMHRGNAIVNLADVGEGNNQLLPVITQSFAGRADINIIEQPALHLHPSAHANVAYRLANAATATGKKYLIESHSENLLLGLRKLVAEGGLKPEDVIIYYIDHDGKQAFATSIEIERNGELSYWPEGVFEEDFELLKEISRGQR